MFARAGGLLHDHPQTRELVEDLLPVNQVPARGQNRPFQHRMLAPIEPEKVAQPPTVHNAGPHGHSILRVVDVVDLEFVPAAGRC